MNTRVLALPIALSCAVLIAGRFPVAPVRDAATLSGVPDVYLGRPTAYLAFAPFSNVLDTITLLSERQDVAVLLGLIAIWSLWSLARPQSTRPGWLGRIRSLAAVLATILVVYSAAAYLPRPMAYLASTDTDVLRIDFHSHTHRSKDARQTYSIERNRAWHYAGGYDVSYVTDHHTFAGGDSGLVSVLPPGKDDVILLQGIEVNWKGEHVGLLGKEQMDRCVLSADLRDMDLRDTTIAGRCGARAPIVIWNHPRDPTLSKLPLASGAVQAIEVANGAIRGMDLVRWKRQQIVALARKYHLALVSGTDSHGWGYAAPNWTLMRLKGWRSLDRDELAARIEQTIRTRGFSATRVVERATADPGTSEVALALSVFLVPWRMLTVLSAAECGMWLVWIWVIAGVTSLLLRRPRGPTRRGLAESAAR